MAPDICSNCGTRGSLIECISKTTWVDYYRCACGQVWSVERPPNEPMVRVVSAPRSSTLRQDRLRRFRDVELETCPRCVGEMWVCDQHPWEPWPHDGCAGPGVPCPICQDPNDRPKRPRGWRSIISTTDDD